MPHGITYEPNERILPPCENCGHPEKLHRGLSRRNDYTSCVFVITIEDEVVGTVGLKQCPCDGYVASGMSMWPYDKTKEQR